MNSDDILALDRQHLWHPYSRPGNNEPLYPVASASGTQLHLSSGESLFDGMSSWWSTIHGYNHPRLNQALCEQSERMSHVMFGGLTHEPAATLAKRLVALSPQGLDYVFISDSGSVAIEVAMKMAMQYWLGLGQQRHRFLTIKNGYHGDTFAAMSVCDPVNGMHHLFSHCMAQQLFAPAPQTAFDDPWQADDFTEFTQLAHQHQDSIAAVILEPIVQGAGGMRFYSPEYLKQVRQLCDSLGIPLIADEIATGFGRSGKLFACEHADIRPDILCVGKALTGGYMSLAATLCTQKIADTVCQGEAGVFMHGPTFMGNPLACAVANASLALLEENNWQQQVLSIEAGLRSGLAPCRDIPGVKDVRVLGAIGVVELDKAVDMAVIQPMFVAHGIWLRPFGKLVYTMPPYIASPDEIAMLSAQIEKVLTRYLSRR